MLFDYSVSWESFLLNSVTLLSPGVALTSSIHSALRALPLFMPLKCWCSPRTCPRPWSLPTLHLHEQFPSTHIVPDITYISGITLFHFSLPIEHSHICLDISQASQTQYIQMKSLSTLMWNTLGAPPYSLAQILPQPSYSNHFCTDIIR